LDPSYPTAHRMLGILLAHMGRHDEAERAVRRARELDPLVAVQHALSAQVAFVAEDYAAAVRFARQAIVIDPEFWVGLFQLAQALVQLGENDQALEALNSAGRFSGGNSKVISLRGYLFARLGRIREALEVLATLQTIARDHYVPPYAMAQIHLGLGDLEQAVKWLEQAYEVRDVHLILLPADPKWKPVRKDARFASLLARCAFFASSLSIS
jgi:tetratricopeptide (TPR) repeat protein